jgi:hypothetical protein
MGAIEASRASGDKVGVFSPKGVCRGDLVF